MKNLLFPKPPQGDFLTYVTCLSLLSCGFTVVAQAQNAAAVTGDPVLDKQREIILGRAAFDATLDKNSDGQIDVRDMTLYINGKPAQATFGTLETRVLPSQGSVQIPIYFNKPVTGTLRLELSGTASSPEDYNTATVGSATPTARLEQIVRQVSLPAASRSWLLNIPLTPPTGDLRGERRLVLTLRAPAVLNAAGNQATRSGPAPAGITSHTIIIGDGAKLWTGTLNFQSGSGFGNLPVSFALGADGTLRTAVRDSRFFAVPSVSAAAATSSGRLTFSGAVSGVFRPVLGPVDANGLPTATGPSAAWSLSMAPAAGITPEIFEYTGQLKLTDFPCAGLRRSFPFSLTLSPSR